MRSVARVLSLVFAAGALGGVANGLIVWLFGRWGIPAAMGVDLAPPFSWPWMYPRVVWGGVWGAALLLPFLGRSMVLRGLAVSLLPSLAMLLIVFPFKLDAGWFGLDRGAATPLFVLVYNAVWGVVAGAWLRLAHPSRRPESDVGA